MTGLNVVQFPAHYAALNLLWVIDAGDGGVDMGLMGKAAEPAMTAYFLAGIAQRKIEGNIGK